MILARPTLSRAVVYPDGTWAHYASFLSRTSHSLATTRPRFTSNPTCPRSRSHANRYSPFTKPPAVCRTCMQHRYPCHAPDWPATIGSAGICRRADGLGGPADNFPLTRMRRNAASNLASIVEWSAVNRAFTKMKENAASNSRPPTNPLCAAALSMRLWSCEVGEVHFHEGPVRRTITPNSRRARSKQWKLQPPS